MGAQLQDDFKELLASFNGRNVEYLIVGAQALAFHGAPRFTGDLDILVRPDPQNAQRISGALADFGFKSVGVDTSDFVLPGQVVQLGVPPVRVDLMTSITGVSWEQAWAGRAAGDYGGVPVFFIGREQYIVNKRAIGRAKDLADIEALGQS